MEPKADGGVARTHLHLDHLGTPRQITDETGSAVALHSYYPFGSEATDPSQDEVELKFTGHERDESGSGGAGMLDYMHARYCSPGLGRFLSIDPVASGKPQDPQSWNKLSYGLNNPTKFVDPDGRESRVTQMVELAINDRLRGQETFLSDPTLQAVAIGTMALMSPIDEGAIALRIGSRAVGLARSARIGIQVRRALRSTNPGTRLEGVVARSLGRSVTSFQRTVRAGGRRLGKIDVETANAIVEVAGGKGRGKFSRAKALIEDAALNPAGKKVIVFGPNLRNGLVQALEEIGATVVRDLKLLHSALD